jgi:hypothetical protein
MAKVQIRSREMEAASAAAELLNAHNEIMDAWFEHWRNEERSRIDLAFKKAGSEHQRRQVA